ncbi:hypothetical protein [Stutzerimonas xanthomarina]|uniref:HipA-like C-terminal domain-containing protein n=2 Tax=Stutzerimonas xanthomarina TaxID=271420 RepID=A0A1M5MRM8_9GAMM|nr:hypothetical protein [Stutzerimonas xanthomarina]MCP9337619.1 hypothetical protein [Stutzerimonas xanthomarina]SEH87334.1 hypothetical protein SAMN05216535_2395 [Stutzerimonas xanthomarina]SHG79453.1 hypothetical protein SAMN02744645_1422 [Stutzerimonas xanthomarina DSM 18231]
MKQQFVQKSIIEIAHWPEDAEFSAAYPEGARPKRTVFSPGDPDELFILSDWRHMFKRSDKKYPEQYWAEIIAYQVAMLLSVNAPPCFAAIDSSRSQCGALSPWFYEEGDESFYSAGNFFHKWVPDFDRDKGTQHNIIDADTFNNRVLGRNQIYEFWSMMLFDSLIGNTDRHQDNWGHLLKAVPLSKSVARRRQEKFDVKWRFAPWFDNGTSLGHELLPAKFTKWDDGALDRYILRGKHHLRYTRDSGERIGHINCFALVEKKSDVKLLLSKKLKGFDIGRLATILDQLVALPAPDGANLTSERAEFILRLTRRRAELLTEKLA